MSNALRANLFALGAIVLWSSLAALGWQLAHVPPFLLTGLGLLVGSVLAWRHWRDWRVSGRLLALGVYGLFGFHCLLFIALRNAPPVEANLVNYLWPLLIVVLAPSLLPSVALRPVHVAAALIGFAGAALAILGTGSEDAAGAGASWGYLPALGSALIWATYSLATRRLADRGEGFPTAAIGLFAMVSGLLSIVCHMLVEPAAALSWRDAGLIALLGLGPLGAAFYLWDRALRLGDPRTIGVLSYLTPLGSTLALVLVSGRSFTGSLLLAAVLVSGAAMLATRQG